MAMKDIILKSKVMKGGPTLRLRFQKWTCELYKLQRGMIVDINILKNTKKKSILVKMQCRVTSVGHGLFVTIPIDLARDYKLKVGDIVKFEITKVV